MALIGAQYPTLLDAAKRTDPDGSIADVVEILNLTNPITQDAPFFEGNLATGHQTTMRSGLPPVAFRIVNGGVQPTKSTTVQQVDTAAELMGYSDVDRRIMELNGNDAAFRLSEDMAFLESMAQQFATTLFYGNTAINPERFLGLAPRYSSLSALNARNIVNAGGTTNLTSLWVVVWGQQTAHMFYPKGTRAGLETRDLGLMDVTMADGSIRPAYRAAYTWLGGLSLRDWRYAVRIANIDSVALANAGDAGYTGPNLVRLLVRAYNQIENMGKGRPVIYVNRTVMAAIDNLAQAKANLSLTAGDYAGEPAVLFRGIPIRLTDAILNTEAQVV